MLINGIEFPSDILKAINDDKLVIFAGAGVSMNAPSNLPDFDGLAKEIGRLCDKEYKSDEDEIDEFLGDLERENVKVKYKVLPDSVFSLLLSLSILSFNFSSIVVLPFLV